jgi:hypothetical protein
MHYKCNGWTAGFPVFRADIEGDLSRIPEVGEAKDFIAKWLQIRAIVPGRPVLDGVNPLR